ncbi:hypothetical protein [Sulfitobacter faviae]|uniref:hypothetical protein n=1 Tax=Sulfitobacter faviae TaxID=1775881 RepID=UPI00398D07F1
MISLIVIVIALFTIGFTSLMWITRVPPQVPATVLDDPALPRLHGDGVLLHGRFAEAEGAPLAVVLHGGPGGDHRSLLALEALSETYRVLFYDQRGAGLSERVTETRLGMADHLADLDALITAQGGGPRSADRPFLGRDAGHGLPRPSPRGGLPRRLDRARFS